MNNKSIPHDTASSKHGKKKKKNKKTKQTTNMVDAVMNSHVNSNFSSKSSNDSFWSNNNNNTEERQKIREFWLQLGEDERRSLVKVEKEAVLRKMKEQQKHSCNCSVCGKKR
jgi:nuclear transport factor 2 (NTF2) superfamily protein